ncbi:hypothetical protein HGM15179_019538, partial [Zosterops borbonicus]
DDPDEGHSTPPDTKSEVKTSDTRSEVTIEPYSLKDLHGPRKDYTRQPDESIISWLVHLWDTAGKATNLNSTEAWHLGSLSHDPVIDQEMMREANPHSLCVRVLGSVAQRYLHADDLYMQQTQWKTIEQGIQHLREMAVAEIVFSDDLNTRNPDLVPCTSAMWRKLVQLGPQEYTSALAAMKRDDMEETALDMAKKLRAYADAMHGPTHARITAVETCLQKLEDRGESQYTQEIREMKEGFLQDSALQIRGSGTKRRCPPDRERRGTSRAELWSFLCHCGGDGMENLQLLWRDGCMNCGKSRFREEVPPKRNQLQLSRERRITRLRGTLPLARPKGIQVGVQDSGCRDRGCKAIEHLAWTVREPIFSRTSEGEEQQVSIATLTVHRQQYRKTRDAVIPIHNMICELESHEMVSKTHSPFNSPIWSVHKSEGEWRLTMDYRALNEVTPPLSAALPDMLGLQYKLESKAAK